VWAISQAEIFLLSHSLARQEDTTSLLLVAQRVPRNRERVQQGCLPSVISYPTLSPNFSLGPCRWPPLWSVTRAGAAAHHPKSAVPTG
jgi:hypothetical protein